MRQYELKLGNAHSENSCGYTFNQDDHEFVRTEDDDMLVIDVDGERYRLTPVEERGD